MRQIVAIVLLTFTVVISAYGTTTNDDVQQGIFDSYLKLANEGDVVAQYVVAQRYEIGKGTEKNLEKAFYWYEKAADQHYPLALTKLEQQKKQQSKAAEPAPAAKPQAKSPGPTPTPKAAQIKTEPAKKAVAPSRNPLPRTMQNRRQRLLRRKHRPFR
jgi:TPR repeat protein